MKPIRPIDANALKDSFCLNCSTLKRYKRSVEECRANTDVYGNVCFKMRLIDKTSTLDYAPVKRGKWIRANEEQAYFDVEYMCSECQFVVAVSGIGTPLLYGYEHCPKCGAKMDGGER